MEVPAILEQRGALRFYDLSETVKLPEPMPEHLTAIGFPGDGLEQIQPRVWTLSGHLLVAKSQPYTGQSLKDFLPRSNFPFEFSPADDGRDPHGFSGTGVWYQPSTPKGRALVPEARTSRALHVLLQTPQTSLRPSR
jgi:hypothetical protein